MMQKKIIGLIGMMLCLVIMGCPNPVSDPLTLTYTVTYDLKGQPDPCG